MSSREERAKLRRASWTGEVVVNGQRKGCLYENLNSQERLMAVARLNQQVWGKAATELLNLPRSEWPGEVFEISRSANS